MSKFEIGQSVLVTNATTGNVAMAGTIVDDKSGWYTVQLTEIDKLVRARAANMVPDYEAPEEAEEEEEAEESVALTAAQKMAQTLKAARVRYIRGKTINGTPTAYSNNAISRSIQAMMLTPEEVAELADKVLGVPAGTHMAKYGTLNNGQIRMNSGNRIRAYWQQVVEAGEEKEIARVARLLELDDEEEEDEDDSEE